MATLLEVLDQGMGGAFHRLRPGMKIGRSKGDIQIQDPNISSLHAKVELDNKQQLVLLDLESSNGLLINGRKVKKIALLPGVSFQIGKTMFRVKEVDDFEAERLAPTRDPRETFKEDVGAIFAASTFPPPKDPKFFSNLIELEFLAGIDVGRITQLSYGPRSLGFLNLDVSLRDPHCPTLAFEISENEKGISITNKSTDGTLNDKVFSESPINSGDILKIGTTQVRITLKPYAP